VKVKDIVILELSRSAHTAYADVCSRVPTYAHVCWRVLTYAKQEMKVKDIMILDLSKRSHNLAAQLKECTKLYELVKVLTLLALLA